MKKENMNPINKDTKVKNENNDSPNKEDMTLLEKLQLRLEKIKKIIKP
jgi:hypothetical protein